MRFSANGYYIEHYVKCANCGLLVYGDGIAGTRHGKACVYCSRLVRRVGRALPTASAGYFQPADRQPCRRSRQSAPTHRRRPTR